LTKIIKRLYPFHEDHGINDSNHRSPLRTVIIVRVTLFLKLKKEVNIIMIKQLSNKAE